MLPSIDLLWALVIGSTVGLVLALSLIFTVLLSQRRYRETQRQKLEAIAASEKKYRDIVAWAPIGIYQTTYDGTFLTVNSALFKMLGYASAEELLQRNIERDIYWNPADHRRLIADHESDGSRIDAEVLWKKKDGTPIWVQLNAHTILDSRPQESGRGSMKSAVRLTESRQPSRRSGTSLDYVGSPSDFVETRLRWSESTTVGRPERTSTKSGIDDRLNEKDKSAETSGFEGFVHDITDRKHAENALRESEVRFRRFSDVALEGIVIHDEGTILDANPTFARIFGYSTSEVIGMNALDFTAPESRDVVLHHFRTGYEEPYEGVGLRKDGSTFFVEMCGRAVPYKGQTARVTIIRDITERKRAEEALRHSEEKYRRFFEEDLSGIFISTTDGRIIDCNPRFANILGFNTVEEVLSVNAYSLYKRPAERDKYLRFLKEKRRLDNDERFLIRKDGKKIRVVSNVIGEFGADGELTRITGYLFDVTERMEAEERYRRLFEESRDVIFISTPEGKLLDINPAGFDLFGYTSEEEMMNIDIARDMYWSPADRERYSRALQRQGYVKDYLLELKRKNGEKLIVLETATAVRNEKGDILAYRGIMRDITDQKKLEDHLRQAQKMESIGTLAGGIAHDFNNILGIILGHLAVLGRSMKDATKIKQGLESLNKAVQRGAGLVRQLLTFARKTETRLESVNVNHVIDDLSRILKETFPKTITMVIDSEQNLPTIVADSNQLHQVFLNLCVNALDAMAGSKGGTLTIHTRTVSGNELRKRFNDADRDLYACISVGDTGTGIDEAVRSHIFEPFFTTKEKGKGTGLGLAVVYGAVKSHHGFIDVESEPGEGSTFHVYFPISQRVYVPYEAKPQVQEEAPGGHETILVVEDEEMLMEIIKSFLEEKGYRVLVARDGEEAVDVYRKRREEISLVLSDMGLPKLGGWDAFRKMKEINPNLRAILASGYVEPNTRSEMLKAGARDFVQKPYDPLEILRRIREVLDSRVTVA